MEMLNLSQNRLDTIQGLRSLPALIALNLGTPQNSLLNSHDAGLLPLCWTDLLGSAFSRFANRCISSSVPSVNNGRVHTSEEADHGDVIRY